MDLRLREAEDALRCLLPTQLTIYIIIPYLKFTCLCCNGSIDEQTIEIWDKKVGLSLIEAKYCEGCLLIGTTEIPFRYSRSYRRAKYSYDCIQCGDHVPYYMNTSNQRCFLCCDEKEAHEFVRDSAFALPLALGAGAATFTLGVYSSIAAALGTSELAFPSRNVYLREEAWDDVKDIMKSGGKTALSVVALGVGGAAIGALGTEVYYQATKRRKLSEQNDNH
jgi:hypothetical protein